MSKCLLIAGNETVLEGGREGRGSPPGSPRPAVPRPPGATPPAGPVQGQPSTCLLPQAVERRGCSRKDSAVLWANLAGRGQDGGWGQPGPPARSPWKPSAPHWRAGGRPARAACPLPQPLTSQHFSSIRTHKPDFSPQVPGVGRSRERGHQVLPSTPPSPSDPHQPHPLPRPALLPSPPVVNVPPRAPAPPHQPLL